MESRRHILDAVRKHQPPRAELPALEGAWITYPDLTAQFIQTLESVGGSAIVADSAEAMHAFLQQQPFYTQAEQVYSHVPGVGRSNVEMVTIDDPHDLAGVDVAVLPGDFAVAENAAVWVTARGLRHRVIYFLVQHLVLVIPAGELLHNMHQAYARLEFREPGFGTFLSGPSKTADIEQSLVIGAHGPRSLTVLLWQANTVEP